MARSLVRLLFHMGMVLVQSGHHSPAKGREQALSRTCTSHRRKSENRHHGV